MGTIEETTVVGWVKRVDDQVGGWMCLVRWVGGCLVRWVGGRVGWTHQAPRLGAPIPLRM